MKKRIVASLLSLCMVLTLLPVTAFAAAPTKDELTITGLNKTSIEYDGQEHPVTAALGEKSLTVKYNNGNTVPKNAGTYTITAAYDANGTEDEEGYYPAGSIELGTLTISQASLSITDVKLKDKVYDASSAAEVESVTFSGRAATDTLTLGTDYEIKSAEFADVTVGNNKNVTVLVGLKGDAAKNYTLNEDVATGTANITKANQAITISAPSISMGVNEKKTFTVTLDVTDASGSVTCTSSAEDIATVAYTNGTATVTSKKAGTANITVAAAASTNCNAAESKTVSVTVTDLPKATVSFEAEAKTITFGDAAPTNTLTATYTPVGGSATPITEGITYSSTDAKVATVSNDGKVTIVGQGTATITATVAEKANTYATGSGSYTLTVNKKALESAGITITPKAAENLKYTGSPIEGVQSVAIKGGADLVANTDYTITYGNNVNVSTEGSPATARIQFKGNYTGDVVYSFSIAKATNVTKALSKTIISSKMTVDLSEAISGVTFTAGDATVSGTNADKFSASVNGTTLTMSKKAEDTELANNDTAMVEVPFTSANYGEGCKVTVTVTYSDKANLPSVSPTSVSLKVAGAGATVTDAEKTATVTVTTDGTVTVTGGTGTVTLSEVTKGEGKSTFTITAAAKGETTITVNVAEGATYAAGSFTISVTVTEKTSSGGGGGGSTGGGGSYGGGGGGTGGTTSDPTTSGGTTSSTVTTTTSGGNATANVSSTTANKLVSQAVENKSTNVTVKVEAGSNVNSVTTQIPASAVDTLAKGSNASLTVDTPVADVVIPNSTLATLGSTSGTVTVKAAVASDKSLTVNVQKNGQDVGALPAPIKVSTPVSETGSGVVAVLVNADGTETVLPKSTLNNGEMSLLLETGSATVKFENRAKDFADVDGHWASNAIDFVSSHGLFQGVTTTTFGASTDTSRAMMVTVLHRLESEPAASGVSFDDVPTGSYYAEAAAWAADLGITQGNGNGFDGDADISREMMVTMLYRYVQKTAPGTGSMGSYAGMTGSNQVSSWAAEAMNWAVGSGLIQGDAKGLRPGDSTSRAEMAAVMQRFVGLLTK